MARSTIKDSATGVAKPTRTKKPDNKKTAKPAKEAAADNPTVEAAKPAAKKATKKAAAASAQKSSPENIAADKPKATRRKPAADKSAVEAAKGSAAIPVQKSEPEDIAADKPKGTRRKVAATKPAAEVAKTTAKKPAKKATAAPAQKSSVENSAADKPKSPRRTPAAAKSAIETAKPDAKKAAEELAAAPVQKSKPENIAASKTKTPRRSATATKPAAETAKPTAKKAVKGPAAASVQKSSSENIAADKPKTPRRKAAATTKGAPKTETPKAVQRPWLASYPEGIAHEIEPFAHTSLTDLMLESCRLHADRPAFISMGKTLTFAELDEKSRHLAAFLLSLGLRKGARVALMMPNLLQYPVALMAVLRAGLVVVNVNPLYTAPELARQLKDSGAEAIIVLENFAATLQKALPQTPLKHVIVSTMGDMLGIKGHAVNFVVRRLKRLVPAWQIKGNIPFKRALRLGAAAPYKPFDVGLDDPAFLQYTGGTTGIAKGAILLHRNVLANTMQNTQWLQTAYIHRPQPRELTLVCALPLYHIYALTVNALMGMQLGAANLLIVNPRDIPDLVKELGKHRFNIIVGLNTLFNAMLNNPDFKKLDFSHLHLTLGGGMAVQRAVAQRWKEVTGGTIHEGYGLSETSPVIAANRFCDEEFTGTIGVPLPSTDVIICDEDGAHLEPGTIGELCVRGPQVMAGYWQQPEETAQSFTADGYLKTGDMAEIDERGFIRIVDRKKDMILVSGFNVYPNEIEEVVMSHPGVVEAAAIGVTDEHSGEVPKVFVVRNDPSLTEQDIIDYCRDKLTGYKRPRYVEFRDSLPKSNVGKFLRRELK